MLAAPAANASPGAYLYALEAQGMVIYNPSQAVNTGYWLCDQMNYTTGDVVATRFYHAAYSDVPTVYVATIWVVAAAEFLCPWHDHSGSYHRLT
jgi:hypothetical protein